MSSRLRTTAWTSAFGGLLGLVSAGIWAANEPNVPDELYYVSESFGTIGEYEPDPTSMDSTFSGAGFWDFSPVPESNLPVSLWVAMPLTTAVVGAVVGIGASAAGIRIGRE